MARKDRGQVEEPLTEDTLGGLPRSNYLSTEPTQTWITDPPGKGELHGVVRPGPVVEQHGFATTIQAMPGHAITKIFDNFPFTKRGTDR